MRTPYVVLISLLFAGLTAAQTATLVGQIQDTSRANVVDASIRVRDVNTNELRTARSSAEGWARAWVFSKWFQNHERAKAQFRWETFNTTNHSNLNLPAINLDKSNAGTITKAKAARAMQVGLRIQF